MKKLLIALAAVMITVASYGQGAVVFNNRVAGTFDAPIVLASDTTVGAGTIAGMKAQLFLVGAGDVFTPLTPATAFRATSGQLAKYISSVDVVIPGNAGTPVTLVLRAFEGADWDSSAALFRGESDRFTVTPSVAPNPPANLTGLGNTPITVAAIPEPSTIALGVLGLGALLLRRRK